MTTSRKLHLTGQLSLTDDFIPLLPQVIYFTAIHTRQWHSYLMANLVNRKLDASPDEPGVIILPDWAAKILRHRSFW